MLRWRSRYTSATSLRDWGGVAVHAALAAPPPGVQPATPTPVILVEGDAAVVARLRSRHERVSHPAVPPVFDRGGADWLALAGEAASDLGAVVERQQLRLPYEAALAIGLTLAEAVAALHRDTGEAMGSVSWVNVLFSRQGRLAVLLAAPVELLPRAPELVAGAPPSPASDVFALLTLFLTLRPQVRDVPEVQRALLAGTARAGSNWEADFVALHRRALAPLAGDRFGDIESAIAGWRDMWRALGVVPRLELAESTLAEALQSEMLPRSGAAANPPTLPLQRREFDGAVKRALQAFWDTGALAQNPLVRSAVLVAGEPGDAGAAADDAASGAGAAGLETAGIEGLRALLRQACAELGAAGEDGLQRDLLRVTYLEGRQKQLAAAGALGLSFATFRRRLQRATQRLTELLWARELAGRQGPPG